MSLPLLAIADLLGVPEADREKLFHWTNSIMNTDDPDFETDYAAANAELMGYAYTMAEERRRCPADDIVTRLIEADIDGESIEDVEFAFFVILLAVAGNETTRNAMTHGMNAFFENPDQWELFKRDRPATAADEIVRWATPGALLPAHRDGRHRAWRGDDPRGSARRPVLQLGQLRRSGLRPTRSSSTSCATPTRISASAATVRTYCIGANLARMEIKLIFNEIADQIPEHRQTV